MSMRFWRNQGESAAHVKPYIVSRQYRIRRAKRVPQVRCSTKCNPISDKVEQNRFCCAIQVLHKKGVLFVFVFCGPAAPGPAPGALGPCARPGLCLAPGASRVPPRSWRGVVLAGGGGSASACRRLAVVAPPARRPPPAPAPRRLAGSLALPSARFGLPCGRPPSAPGAAWPRMGARWGPRRPTGRLLPLRVPRAPQTAA
jgi:hypothetical protein